MVETKGHTVRQVLVKVVGNEFLDEGAIFGQIVQLDNDTKHAINLRKDGFSKMMDVSAVL